MTVSDQLAHSGLGETDDVDLDSLWMAPWDACGTLGTGCRPGISIWRDVLCCIARLSRMPVLPVTGYSRSFRGLGRTCILDLNAGESKAPVRIMGDERQTDFPRPQFPPCGVRVLPSASATLVRGDWRRRGCAGNGHSPGDKCMTDLHDRSELDFPQASLTPGECCVEELDYLRPALLAVLPVYAWTVTGSLLFGSPHRRVRGCYQLTLLCHPRFDVLVTLNCRFTPAIITLVLISTGSGSSFCWACVIAHSWEPNVDCACRDLPLL